MNGSAVHLRGRANLDALLEALDRAAGLFGADEVVFSGTSAGGLATYLHASYVKSRLRRGARLFAAPDAGFFLSSGTFQNASDFAFARAMAGAYDLWNASLGGAGARCVAANAAAPSRCLFAEHVYPFLDDIDGAWVINSLVDPSQLRVCFGLDCELGATCSPAQQAAALAYAARLQRAIEAAAATFGARDGYFLTSCAHHEQSCRFEDWYGVRVGGASPNASFAAFVRGAGARARAVDVQWPGDASCWAGPLHGGC